MQSNKNAGLIVNFPCPKKSSNMETSTLIIEILGNHLSKCNILRENISHEVLYRLRYKQKQYLTLGRMFKKGSGKVYRE